MIIWGRKGYSDFLGYVIMTCPKCGTQGPFEVYQFRKKFTLYLVPTFTYSSKQALVCCACQAKFEVPDDKKEVVAKNLLTQDELSALIRRARGGR